jgi:hypothetical protein
MLEVITPAKAHAMREGLGGGHFYDTFRSCPRKWFLKYVIGLKERTFAKALNYGSAVHEAFSEFYKDWNKDTLIGVTLERIDEARDKYYNLLDYTKDRNRAVDSLTKWYSQFGISDKETFDVLENEEEHVGVLSNGFEYRIRPDRIMREKATNKVFIFDTKTTGVGVSRMFEKTAKSDQPTGYTKIMKPKFGDNFGGWITDCLYSRSSVHQCERSSPVLIDQERSELWEIGLMSDMEDLTNRHELYKEGTFPSEYLFPARKGACSVWGCPYSSICDKRLSVGINPNDYGFDKDEWTENNYIDILMSENKNNLKKGEQEC